VTVRVRPTHVDAGFAARWRACGAWKDEPLGATFEATMAKRSEATAIVDRNRRISYAELDDLTRRLAAILVARGVGPGDTVTMQLPAWWETFALIVASWRIGAVANPVLPNLRAHELELITTEAGSRVLVVPERFRGFDHLDMAARLSHEADVLVVRSARPAQGTSLDDLLRTVEPMTDGALAACAPSPDDAALVLYTSGTTSGPKGVVHTHNTLRAEADGIELAHEVTKDDTLLVTMPLAHVGGMLYGILLPVVTGVTAVLLDQWDADEAVDLAVAEAVSVLVGVPVMLRAMLTSTRYRPGELAPVRLFVLGGTRVTAADVNVAAEALDCWSKRTYGSTEMPTATTGPRRDPGGRLATTDGVPIGPVEVRIVDDAGNDVAPGERGEILCQGPELFVGYVDAHLNRAAFTDDGWFRTGDVGVMDGDGFLTVVDRKKDIIIRGGENISAQEVEELILAMAGVEDVAIVAMPDPVMGERSCAFVIAPAHAVTLAEVVAHLRSAGLASFKFPERLERREEFSRTATGKIRKDVLRSEIAALVANDG
jgi:cyclohexanecarboxylate-CoA ligase